MDKLFIVVMFLAVLGTSSVVGHAEPIDLDGLVATYRGYGLPLPPSNTPLVRYADGFRSIAGGKQEPVYHLAFVLRPAKDDQPAVLLVGTEEYRPIYGEEITPIDPAAVKPDEIDPSLSTTFDVNAGLATAIQCKARGWDVLAIGLLTRSLSVQAGDQFSIFFQPADLQPKTAIAHLAWAHYGNELVRRGTDRTSIDAKIHLLFATEPSLDIEPNQALLHSLEMALPPSNAKSGTADALIHDLVEMDDEDMRSAYPSPDPHYVKLALLGFEAVPALIEHLDDDRLTRSVKRGFDNFPTWNKRVCDVVSDLLQELAGADMGRDWLKQQQGFRLDRAVVQKWWQAARSTGEEAYAVAHVLSADAQNEWPDETLLRIIAARYQNRLPELYNSIVDNRPSMQSEPIAKAIMSSGLPRQQKLDLFLRAARSKHLEFRRAAFGELRELDEGLFKQLLIQTLDGLPPTPDGKYWACPEASFASLVTETDDSSVWAAMGRAARRADVGLRMEMLDQVTYYAVDNKHRRNRVEFIKSFLDDLTIRDETSDTSRFTGPYAGFGMSHLAVGNLAAIEVASMLKLEAHPWLDSDLSPDQWSARRQSAKEAADRELNRPSTQPSQ